VFLLEGTHLLEACAVDYPLVTVFSTQNGTHYISNFGSKPVDGLKGQKLSVQVLKIATRATGWCGGDGKRSYSQSKVPFTGLGLVLELCKILATLGNHSHHCRCWCNRVMVKWDSVDLDNPKVLRASAGQWFGYRWRLVRI